MSGEYRGRNPLQRVQRAAALCRCVGCPYPPLTAEGGLKTKEVIVKLDKVD